VTKAVSIQEIEDLERKKKELERRKAQMLAEAQTTPVDQHLTGPAPTASRMKKAPNTVPRWEKDF
jgi:hypothetical protein